MAFKRKGFPKHATVSAFKEYIPQSQRQMKQYIPQTEMDWNDPRREKLDHYVTEGDTIMPSEPEVVRTSVDTQPVSTEYLPSASSNEPEVNISTPTESEYISQTPRVMKDRKKFKDTKLGQFLGVGKGDERKARRAARRANRKANRRRLGSKIRDLFSRGSKHPVSGVYRGTKLIKKMQDKV